MSKRKTYGKSPAATALPPEVVTGDAVLVPPGVEAPADQVAAKAVRDMATNVEEAIKPNYRGLICNAYVTENMVFGNIYNDTEKEYDDGELIRTAAIVSYLEPDRVDCNNGIFKVEWTQAQLDKFAAQKAT